MPLESPFLSWSGSGSLFTNSESTWGRPGGAETVFEVLENLLPPPFEEPVKRNRDALEKIAKSYFDAREIKTIGRTLAYLAGFVLATVGFLEAIS